MASEHAINHKFESIEEAVNHVFQSERTSLLSFDRICEVLKNDNLYYASKKQGIQPCSSISRRRISFILSTSDHFIRAGTERSCMWQLKPHNELYLSDSTIRSFIEQLLSTNGPMTIQQILNSSSLSGANEAVYQRFFKDNESYFTMSEEGTFWFANEPIPRQNNFENINAALVHAMKEFPDGASIEEVHWFLCLSTINGAKTITRRSISRELSRRPELFLHVSRARYMLNKEAKEESEAKVETELQNTSLNDFLNEEYQNEDDFFDPSSFFGNDVFNFDGYA